MRRSHHLLAATGAFVLLVSLGSPWFSFQLPTGATLSRSGLETSSLGATLVAAAFASYGAALLTKGIFRRFLGLLQSLMGGLAFASWLMVLQAPVEAVTVEIIALTGLEGSQAFAGVIVAGPSWAFSLALLGAAMIALSGLAGAIAGDKQSGSTRYRLASESGLRDPVSTWDNLSEGLDPTKR